MPDLTEHLLPLPKKVEPRSGVFKMGAEAGIWASDPEALSAAMRQISEDLAHFCASDAKAESEENAEIRLTLIPATANDEAYSLKIDPSGIQISGGGARGVFHGAQTLAQIIAAHPRDAIPCCEIEDEPRYAERSVMLDLGRAPFSVALLQRIIKILARIKINTVHLHLNDDHLCGVRFETLPLGLENPFALTIAELAGLVEFARLHHIRIVPEFESWGHAGSVVYHYPELRGGPGRWEGVSFGIGRALYRVLREVFGELLGVFGESRHFHTGMDEAIWAVLPEDEGRNLSPQTHLREVHRILKEEAANQHREIRMRIWLDHEPAEIPEDLRDQISAEPWAYNLSQEEEIRRKVAYCTGRTYPFMMGGGMSSLHFDGTYDATRIWCREAIGSPAVEGIDMCIWETNHFSAQFIGVFVGADYAWRPRVFAPDPHDPFGERERGKLTLKMKRWQNLFREASPWLIDADRGPEVYRGKYVWHEGDQPLYVAPTAALLDPASAEFEKQPSE